MALALYPVHTDATLEILQKKKKCAIEMFSIAFLCFVCIWYLKSATSSSVLRHLSSGYNQSQLPAILILTEQKHYTFSI